MGENIVMLGWTKVAFTLGCRRVIMFESHIDFINYVDKMKEQVYILDYLSIPIVKDDLLLDEALTKRTWWFAYFGLTTEDIRESDISQEYGFKTDHALLPYNYSNYSDAPNNNRRVGVLPTTIAMNHVKEKKWKEPKLLLRMHSSSERKQQRCNAFFMGKSAENVEGLKALIGHVEGKLRAMNSRPKHHNVTICTGVKLSEGTSLSDFLGYPLNYTINLGRMEPAAFADLVGSVQVVIGSGHPAVSPTITDAIFGGAFFMAPAKQFRSMEDHPLFIKSDKVFETLDQQADRIVHLLLNS
ncbi:hypothetical protein ACHAWF_005769, partial [Thalassiosira exigua]